MEKVNVMFSSYTSSVAFVCSEVAEKYHIPYLVSSSFVDKITERSFKYLFRNVYKAGEAPKAALEFFIDIGNATGNPIKSVAVVTEKSLFGVVTGDRALEECASIGMSVVGHYLYDASSTDLSSIVTQLKALNPYVILGCHYLTDSLLVLTKMKDLDWSPKRWVDMGDAGGMHPDFLAKGKEPEARAEALKESCLDVFGRALHTIK